MLRRSEKESSFTTWCFVGERDVAELELDHGVFGQRALTILARATARRVSAVRLFCERDRWRCR